MIWIVELNTKLEKRYEVVNARIIHKIWFLLTFSTFRSLDLQVSFRICYFFPTYYLLNYLEKPLFLYLGPNC